MSRLSSFSGKVAIITGAASGIGRGMALKFAENGATVVIADINQTGGEAVARELQSLKATAAAIEVDVAVPARVDAMVKQVLDRFGRIDILINDAGINIGAPAVDMTMEQWDRTLAVNLSGPMLCSRAVGPQMIKQGGGKIVNIASTGGHAAIPGSLAYCVSKSGVIALTRVLALEWAKYKINVNSISPGRTNTPMVAAIRKTQPAEEFERRTRRIPLGRIAEMTDIANLAMFLASPEADYITGQDILIEGGMLAVHPGHVQS